MLSTQSSRKLRDAQHRSESIAYADAQDRVSIAPLAELMGYLSHLR